MTLENRIAAFAELGQFLRLFTAEKDAPSEPGENHKNTALNLSEKVSQAVHHNGWFTKENIYFSLEQWGTALSEDKLRKWVSNYDLSFSKTPKTIGIVMAGNIPLVGFHDFLSVLLTGNKVLAKLSSTDNLLLPVLAEFLISENPEFSNLIVFTKEKLEHYDAIIATGSNNTARYFDYYFSKKTHIIRKNRNSVAVLSGGETDGQLALLAEDIFRYYGLGCRNVSKLFVPENYDFTAFFQAIFPWNPIVNHAKYANNYDYNKAVYLMSEFKLLDNGFLLLKEDPGFGSPIATLFYETYQDEKNLKEKLRANTENLQCVVSDADLLKNSVDFGKTQYPELWDYADGVDTLEFLVGLGK